MTFILKRDTTGVPVAAYNENKDIIKIDTVRKAFRDDFQGVLLDTTTKWTVIQTGAGQTVSVANGYLSIAAGNTVNAETIIKSKESYRLPVALYAILSISQRVANQEFYIELVNGDGTHGAGFKFDSTVATQAKYFNENVDVQKLSSAATIVTTAADHIAEIEALSDRVQFHSRTMNAARANSYTLMQCVPDANEDYYIQIRAKNLASAPTTGTILTIDAISLVDMSNLSNSALAII